MTKNKYRTIDLFIFAAIVTALEAINIRLLDFFPGEVFTLSVTMAVSLIVMMRWGAWGLIHAALGGLVYCLANLFSGAEVQFSQFLIYTLGNLLIGLDFLFLKYVGKEKVRNAPELTVIYALIGCLTMNLGRAIVSAVFNGEFLQVLIRMLAVDALNAIITAIILLVARRQNGVFEDQNHYLLRLEAERKNENTNSDKTN